MSDDSELEPGRDEDDCGEGEANVAVLAFETIEPELEPVDPLLVDSGQKVV